MSSQKIAAVLYLLSSVMILVGFVAQFTSYSKDGMTVVMVGFGLMTLVNVGILILILNANAPCSKELRVYERAVNWVRVFGTTLSFLGLLSINIMGTSAFVWVGVVGCLLMSIGGVALLAKELWIEQLEEDSLLPLNRGELK